MSNTYPRWLADRIKEALNYRRIVILSGARQTGKTTLAEELKAPNFEFRTLDDPDLLQLAITDPKGFIKTSAKTLVVDEIQKAPKLIPAIKMAVDKDNRKGQFLLTGSVNLQTIPTVTESLAGRVKNIRLRPLTIGEINNRKPVFLERAFNADFPTLIQGYDKGSIFELAFRGGYPEAVHIKNFSRRSEWHRDYLKTLIDTDLADIANIRRKGALEEMLAILAAWSSKLMDLNAIGASLSITKETLYSYVNWLLSIYIFDKVQPWLKTDYERAGRKSKIYAADSGLMTSILSWKIDEIMLDTDRSGKLIETFVFQELAALIDFESRYSLYHYRDREKREIDFVIERDDGAVLGIEVKAGHSVSKADFKHQKWFAENILKNKKPFTGLVLYSGDRTLRFEENMAAVPTAALWL